MGFYHRQFRLFTTACLLLLGACWQSDRGNLEGEETATPGDFRFVGRTIPCFLEVQSAESRSLRVNCFHVDGNLHIHSNRFSKMRRLRGESWVETVRREPQVRIAIDHHIYRMRATPIEDEILRVALLHERGYVYAWDGITVFRFQ